MATRIDGDALADVVVGKKWRVLSKDSKCVPFGSALSSICFPSCGRNFSLIWFLVVFLMLLAGCTPEPSPMLRVGTNTWTGYEPLYLARDAGFFQGANIRLVEYGASTEVIRAFRNNAIQAAGLTLDEVLLLAQDGHRPCIVGVLDASNGADALIGQKNISRLSDLKGKRVGAESTALGGYMLARALQFAKLTRDDITVVSLPVNEHSQAFKRHHVDALVTFDPVRTHLMSSGANLLFDSSRLPGEIVDVLVVECSFLNEHVAETRVLVQGWLRAVQDLHVNQDGAIQRMAPHLGLSPAEVSASLKVVSLAGLNENRRYLAGDAPSLLPSLQRTMLYMIDQRLLNATVDVKRIIDSRFLNEDSQ